MRVRFFAYLRNITGCPEAEVPYRETADALARYLCELYGDALRQKIFPRSCASQATDSALPDSEELGPEIIILVNGRHIAHLGGIAAPLKPDDRVDIFPVVAGG